MHDHGEIKDLADHTATGEDWPAMRVIPRVDDRRPPLPDVLSAASRGEQWAIDELAAECLPKLTSFAEARGAVDPGGVASVVLMEFFRRLESLSFDGPGQMWAYLYRIARSRVVDERRATKPMELWDRPDIESRATPTPEFTEEVADRDFVDGLLSGLTIDQREVLELRFLDDLSIEETATRTGRSLTAVKGLQRRAMRALSAAALVAVLVVIVGVVWAVLRDDGAVTMISEDPAGSPPSTVDVLEVDTENGAGTDGATRVVGGPLTEPNESEAPSTAIVASEPNEDSARTMTFRFAATGGISGVQGFECRLDLGDWVECSSPRTYRDLIDGSHLFEVRAQDREGNVDPTPAAASWSVAVGTSDGVPYGVDMAALRASDTVYKCLGAQGTFAQLEAEGYDVMIGTDGDDVIDVSAGDRPDLVIGKAGNDTITTGSGDDRVCGDEGNDTIDTGPGKDRVSGGDGNDSIFGGDHDDNVWGGSGNDTILGGGGNDVLRGEGGVDIVDGQWGDDRLTGGAGPDILVGASGTDLCEDPDVGLAADEAGCEKTAEVPDTSPTTSSPPPTTSPAPTSTTPDSTSAPASTTTSG